MRRDTQTHKRSPTTGQLTKERQPSTVGPALFRDALWPAVQRLGLITKHQLTESSQLGDDNASSQGKYSPLQRAVLEQQVKVEDINQLMSSWNRLVLECPSCENPLNAANDEESGERGLSCPACQQFLPAPRSPPRLTSVEILTAQTDEDLRIPYEPFAAPDFSHPFERYEVLEELGRGGYGVVFRAHDRYLQRDVALKTFRTRNRRPMSVMRFQREGEAMARLRHPKIVQVYTIGRHGGLMYICMEYIRGQSFKFYLKDNPKLDDCLDIFESVLEAVDFANDKGVLHRDLKPSNILIPESSPLLIETAEGPQKCEGRLFDFGLAKDFTVDEGVTVHREIVGTPFYTSPDQILFGANKIDGRSEVFAMGVILYEILAGRRPFLGRNRSDLYTKILHEDPAPLSQFKPGIFKSLEHVCFKALEKERKKRFKTAGEFLEALRKAREDPDFQPKSRSGRSSRRRRKKKRRRDTKQHGSRSRREKDAKNRDGKDPKAKNKRPPKARASGRLRQKSEMKDSLKKTSQGSRSAVRTRMRRRHCESNDALTKGWIIMIVLLIVLVLGGVLFSTPAFGQDKDLNKSPAKLDQKEVHKAQSQVQHKDWIYRAFAINRLADSDEHSAVIRAVRHGLSDKHQLVRAFSLRALKDRPTQQLRAYGATPLFEGLVLGMKSKEPFVSQHSEKLLRRLAGNKAPRPGAKARDWKNWWKQFGKSYFEQSSALVGPGLQREQAQQAAEPQDDNSIRDTDQISTKERKKGERVESIEEFFSVIRERGLEVVFVLDVTQSMTDELKRVREQVQELTGFFIHLLPKKTRLGLVTYDNEVVQSVKLTSKLPKFARYISKVDIYKNPANRTYCEGVDKGLQAALNRRKMGWLKKTFKTVVILGDAPPHAKDRKQSVIMAKQGAAAGVSINAIVTKPPKVVPGAEPLGPMGDITKAGEGMLVNLEKPEELITKLLVVSFGPRHEKDLRRFVDAYRMVTKDPKKDAPKK